MNKVSVICNGCKKHSLVPISMIDKTASGRKLKCRCGSTDVDLYEPKTAGFDFMDLINGPQEHGPWEDEATLPVKWETGRDHLGRETFLVKDTNGSGLFSVGPIQPTEGGEITGYAIRSLNSYWNAPTTLFASADEAKRWIEDNPLWSLNRSARRVRATGTTDLPMPLLDEMTPEQVDRRVDKTPRIGDPAESTHLPPDGGVVAKLTKRVLRTNPGMPPREARRLAVEAARMAAPKQATRLSWDVLKSPEGVDQQAVAFYWVGPEVGYYKATATVMGDEVYWTLAPTNSSNQAEPRKGYASSIEDAMAKAEQAVDESEAAYASGYEASRKQAAAPPHVTVDWEAESNGVEWYAYLSGGEGTYGQEWDSIVDLITGRIEDMNYEARNGAHSTGFDWYFQDVYAENFHTNPDSRVMGNAPTLDAAKQEVARRMLAACPQDTSNVPGQQSMFGSRKQASEECAKPDGWPCLGPATWQETNGTETRQVCVGHLGVSRGWTPVPSPGVMTKDYPVSMEASRKVALPEGHTPKQLQDADGFTWYRCEKRGCDIVTPGGYDVQEEVDTFERWHRSLVASKKQGAGEGAYGWDLVPSSKYPGENDLVCPKCGSANVTMDGGNMLVGRGKVPGYIECQGCGLKTMEGNRYQASHKVAGELPSGQARTDYRNGYKAGKTGHPDALGKADGRGVSEDWYLGFHDGVAGAPMWEVYQPSSWTTGARKKNRSRRSA